MHCYTTLCPYLVILALTFFQFGILPQYENLNVISADLVFRNAIVQYDEKPSMIIIKYNAPPADWTWDDPHMSMCTHSSMFFSLGVRATGAKYFRRFLS